MKCAICKKSITAVQARNAVQEKDDKGRVVGMRHGKCKRVADRAARREGDETWAGKDVPGVYEAAERFGDERRKTPEAQAMRERQLEAARLEQEALEARRQEIAQQRSLEAVPTAWSDWRGPSTAELDDNEVGTGDVVDLS